MTNHGTFSSAPKQCIREFTAGHALQVCLPDGRLGQTALLDSLTGRAKVRVDSPVKKIQMPSKTRTSCGQQSEVLGVDELGETRSAENCSAGNIGNWAWRDQSELLRLGTAQECQTVRTAAQMRALVACWSGRYWETKTSSELQVFSIASCVACRCS